MQPVDNKNILESVLSDHLPSQHPSKTFMNGTIGGLHTAKPSTGGLRDRHGFVMPAINTTRSNQNMINGQNASDMQTPGTGYDMNFTPLLPSQLLMGSPFQPGSPTSFGPSQYQTLSNITQQNSSHPAQHSSNQVTSPLQNQPQLSPPMYQNMMSPTGMTTSGFFGGGHMALSAYGGMANNIASPVQLASGLVSGTSRTVYLGNIPADTTAEELLGHVRSGQIESVRLLQDKNCAFISFLDSSSAVHFHSDAILKKLAIRGQDIKVGWGKPSQVPSSVAVAVQQSGASRNVYLGTLPPDITEEEIREDLSKFGLIDTIKLVKEKAIGFVHFLSISSAMKAVSQLPQETKWQAPRRVFYGKDRCAYVSKTQQQNAAQYLGIAPGYAHVLNAADRDMISNALAQQSVAAAAVATAAGGANNLGNRTVYLGNIHPETTTEEICNVVRGGLLHHIRYIADKHICFVTFIDPTAAASFYALSNMQGLMIHNRRLKIGWGKHSGALPPAIALAVSGGASRNVYIGNIDETWSEERLRQDFSEYGEIELINTLREKSCAFVNFTNIANAIKAIEAVRGKEQYKRFKINFGKDRCGNPPRQTHQSQQDGFPMQNSHEDTLSPPPTLNGTGNAYQTSRNSGPGSNVSPVNSGVSRGAGSGSGHLTNGSVHQLSASVGGNNPLTVYLNQMSNQSNVNIQGQATDATPSVYTPAHQHQYSSVSAHDNFYHGGHSNSFSKGSNSLEPPSHHHPHYTSHSSSNSFSMNTSGSGNGSGASGMTTVGGLLAPSNVGAAARAQHSRAISLPAFTQVGPYNQSPNGNTQQQYNQQQQQQQQQPHQLPQNNRFGGLGAGVNGYGLAIGDSTLPRWAEEEVTS